MDAGRCNTLHSWPPSEKKTLSVEDRWRRVTQDWLVTCPPHKSFFYWWNGGVCTSLLCLPASGDDLRLAKHPSSTGWGPIKSKASSESNTCYAAFAAALCSKCIGQSKKPSQRNSMSSASTAWSWKHHTLLSIDTPKIMLVSRFWKNLDEKSLSLPNHQSQERRWQTSSHR